MSDVHRVLVRKACGHGQHHEIAASTQEQIDLVARALALVRCDLCRSVGTCSKDWPVGETDGEEWKR